MTNTNQTLNRAGSLADRLLLGANQLTALAEQLSDENWNKPVIGDGRSIGVVIHHVASVYPIEVELAQVIASGNPITEVTKEAIDQMNAGHAEDNSGAEKNQTLELLRQNSQNAADAIRKFTDKELDTATTVSLYYNAPLTAQFFIEDHALRHSFHHMGKIKASL